ncbi:MAG: hypothetical protein JW963_01800, partial [Anaerolineales bacterium]|nr:hypothetical protein [Anaerolineales bacterium]
MKRLQQVQDIVDFNGNALLWSCMGSAAIGLQYLDREANEIIPPRLRFYGYLNDGEFSRECTKHGITAYAVVWKAQMWEFPAEFNDDESELLALNKLKGEGKQGWIGMRELSTDRYPKLFEPISKYFPDGLRNSEGELVTDFLEEFKIRTLDGNDVQSAWLLVPGHDHYCYTPCGTNPAFAEYQKKQVEMMIDAGAGGVMVDEIDMHLYGLLNAGCFCKDCMKGFRAYLKAHPSEETVNLDLDTFNYRDFLKARGYTDHDLLGAQTVNRAAIPLYTQFVQFNLEQVEVSLAEVLDHAKAYSKQVRGHEVPVAANLFNCLPHTSMLRKHCDLIIGEKSGLELRQDGFYRFGYAFFQGKDGSFIEDPNDHILKIVDDLKDGKTDVYVLFMLEPLSQGFNVAIPYGAWLINLVQDSFYPDMETERQMGDWLKAHEDLFAPDPVAETAILYDTRSAIEIEMFQGGYLDRKSTAGFRTFHDLNQMLCDNHVLANVLYVSDDQPLTPERLNSYRTLLLPDAFSLHKEEMDIIDRWLDSGGRAMTFGQSHRRFSELRSPFVKPAALLNWIKEGGQPVDILEGDHNAYIGLGLHKTDQGFALHIVNYWLNDVSRTIETIPQATFKLSMTPRSVRVHTFPPSEA